MSPRRRVCLLAFLPVACVAYACSSDDNVGTSGGVFDGGIDTSVSVPRPLNDGSSEVDSALPPEDAGSDATTAPDCTGNPLGEDGDAGTPAAVATGHFLDGPQWIDDAIVYSEVTSQVVVKNGPAGGMRTVLRATGSGEELPIGNARTGSFIYTAMSRTTDGGKGAILRMLLDGGDPTSFEAGEANSPNDLVASSKGFVYFTDPAYQNDGISTGVYRLSPEGAITTIIKYDGGLYARADGIALSKDESALYVGYYDQKRIVKYAVDAAGNASNPADVTLTLVDNPTGIALDTAGNLWIAESPSDGAVHGRVEVFSATGQKWGQVTFADARPTGVAFGGADGLTVFITSERGSGGQDGTLYALKTRCAGVR
jgi:gluconolactonase